MKSFVRFALLALVLVVIAMVSALTAMRLAIHGQEVAVPAVVGLAPAEAERVVGALGLQMEIERKYYSAQIPEGKIMSQLPLSGTKVRRGWQLRVAQSLGPMRITIPDVAGQSERAAELNILRRGLEVASKAEVQMPGIPADQVLAQSPPANASQVSAPKISLLISNAVEAPAYVMPNFVGQPLGSVSRTLQDAGFKLGNVSVAAATPPSSALASSTSDQTTATSSQPAAPASQSAAPAQPTPASIIVSHMPAAGQKVAAGAVVNLEVR
jgi:beta-lactam-binding protein with PASTA domain